MYTLPPVLCKLIETSLLQLPSKSRIRKVRALVQDLNNAFAYVLATKGSKRVIVTDGIGVDGKQDMNELPLLVQRIARQYNLPNPRKMTLKAITEEIGTAIPIYGGNKFSGIAHRNLAVEFFRDQAQPWEAALKVRPAHASAPEKCLPLSVPPMLGSPQGHRFG